MHPFFTLQKQTKSKRILSTLIMAVFLFSQFLLLNKAVSLPLSGTVPDESVNSYDGLSAAIGAAPTDGTLYIIEITGNITLTRELTITNKKNIMIYSDANGPWTLTRNNGSNSSSSGSRHFEVNDATTKVAPSSNVGILTLENIVLDGGGVSGGVSLGHASDAVNAICVGGVLYLNEGAVIQNCSNSASQNGGGLTVNNGGKAIINGGKIINCKKSGTNGGGGVYIAHSALNIFTMIDGEISGNQATSSSTGCGGGISMYGGSTIHISGGKIYNNSAYKEGGGIYVGNGTFHMAGGEISGNKSSNSSGGGVYVGTSSTLQMEGGIVFGNEAKTHGGGVYAAGALTVNQSSIYDNIATGYGGGVYANKKFTVNGSTISGNNATLNGGGIYLDSSASAPSALEITESAISGNKSAASGGGIYSNTGSTVTIHNSTIGGDTQADVNTAVNGGGIYLNSSASAPSALEITGSIISGNKSTTSGGGIYGYTGSAVTIRNSTIGGDTQADANTAASGGGIYGYTNSAITILQSSVSSNKVTNNGGGIYIMANSILEVSGQSRIIENNADKGGGIYTASTNYSNLTTGSDTVFHGNRASAAYTPPQNAQSLYPAIQFAKTSIAAHPLNNFDINYSSQLLTFTLMYDANAGSGSYTAVNIKPGDAVAVLSPEEAGISHESHTFVKWNTQADGSGADYRPGDSITVIDNTTLYAQWAVIPAPTEPVEPTEPEPSELVPPEPTSTESLPTEPPLSEPESTTEAEKPTEEITSRPMVSETESSTETELPTEQTSFESTISEPELTVETENPAAENSPETGDDSNIVFWIALLCISFSAMVILTWKLKEKR